MTISRKQFLQVAFGAVAAAALGGSCGDGDHEDDADGEADGSDSDGGLAECDADAIAEIGSNHPQPHELQVSAADIATGEEKTYGIRGQSSHGHQVTITEADFERLLDGDTIVVDSVGGGHVHSVTLRCA